MGLRLISREFTDANGRTGDYPKGVTNDIAVSKYTIEYLSSLDLSTTVQVIKKGNRFRLLSGDWQSLISAFNGANIDFDLDGSSVTSTTIDTVDGIDLYLVGSGTKPDATYAVGNFTVTDNPVSFEHYINLFQNSKKQGTKFSLIDGETQRFKVDLVNALSVSGTDTFEQFGKRSGGSIITSTITRIADVNGNKRYEIETTFKYWLYLDDSIYNADDSIGYYTEIFGFPQLGSTNTSVSLIDSINGDIGNKDESLNGGDNPWTFVSIDWEDDSTNSMETFDFTQNSNFEIRINGAMTGNELFNFRFYRTPNDQDEYKNKKLPIDNNISLVTNESLLGYSAPRTKSGETNEDGAGFTINSFQVSNNTDHIIVQGSIQSNSNMQTLFQDKSEDDRGYVFEVCIDGGSSSYQRSKTVNVLCDKNNSKVNTIPLGVYSTSKFIVEDINDADIGSSPIIPSEDYVILCSNFTLPKNTNENPWKNIELKVVAVKTDGSEFDLEIFPYDLQSLPPQRDGKLPIDYTLGRGYKLPSTSNKNTISIQLKPSLDDGSNFGVEILYPFQIRYEYWLDEPNASDDFFGNKTKNWYTYSSDPDWSLEARVVLNRDTGTYTNPFDFSISTGQSLTTFTFERLDGTPINKPLKNEPVKLIATVTAATNWTTDLWGSITARGKETVPSWELSTLEDPTDNANPLYPLTTETRLAISNDGVNLVFECLFDMRKINNEFVTFGCRAHGNTI